MVVTGDVLRLLSHSACAAALAVDHHDARSPFQPTAGAVFARSHNVSQPLCVREASAIHFRSAAANEYSGKRGQRFFREHYAGAAALATGGHTAGAAALARVVVVVLTSAALQVSHAAQRHLC